MDIWPRQQGYSLCGARWRSEAAHPPPLHLELHSAGYLRWEQRLEQASCASLVPQLKSAFTFGRTTAWLRGSRSRVGPKWCCCGGMMRCQSFYGDSGGSVDPASPSPASGSPPQPYPPNPYCEGHLMEQPALALCAELGGPLSAVWRKPSRPMVAASGAAITSKSSLPPRLLSPWGRCPGRTASEPARWRGARHQSRCSRRILRLGRSLAHQDGYGVI